MTILNMICLAKPMLDRAVTGQRGGAFAIQHDLA